ncbi:MAG TPA: hypothetical protein VEL07_13720 [Planctomycetota bacterium]|nr:hypothetical protein [Planctomycetota bacterium]
MWIAPIERCTPGTDAPRALAPCPLGLNTYLELVDQTRRIVRSGKRAAIPAAKATGQASIFRQPMPVLVFPKRRCLKGDACPLLFWRSNFELVERLFPTLVWLQQNALAPLHKPLGDLVRIGSAELRAKVHHQGYGLEKRLVHHLSPRLSIQDILKEGHCDACTHLLRLREHVPCQSFVHAQAFGGIILSLDAALPLRSHGCEIIGGTFEPSFTERRFEGSPITLSEFLRQNPFYLKSQRCRRLANATHGDGALFTKRIRPANPRPHEFPTRDLTLSSHSDTRQFLQVSSLLGNEGRPRHSLSAAFGCPEARERLAPAHQVAQRHRIHRLIQM